jgi:hypothetical protein
MFLNEGEIPREKKNNPNNLPQFHVEKTNQKRKDILELQIEIEKFHHLCMKKLSSSLYNTIQILVQKQKRTTQQHFLFIFNCTILPE